MLLQRAVTSYIPDSCRALVLVFIFFCFRAIVKSLKYAAINLYIERDSLIVVWDVIISNVKEQLMSYWFCVIHLRVRRSCLYIGTRHRERHIEAISIVKNRLKRYWDIQNVWLLPWVQCKSKHFCVWNLSLWHYWSESKKIARVTIGRWIKLTWIIAW